MECIFPSFVHTAMLQVVEIHPHRIQFYQVITMAPDDQWPLLLTWFNFNPSMDK